MVRISQISWGSFSAYEGPFFRGDVEFSLPPNPDFWDKCMYVLASTEGKINAINAYDVCIMSLGFTQWCDKFFLATNLLGYIQEHHSDPEFVNKQLVVPLQLSKATFKKNSKGQYRFFFLDERGEVNTNEKQRQLYFNGSSGKKGEWSNDQKTHAKQWAVGLASLLSVPEAIQSQMAMTKPRLINFVPTDTQKILFDDEVEPTSWVLAARAALISFAANNPKWATQAFKNALLYTTHERWSKEWVINLLKDLTYYQADQIAGKKIYPIRYDAIRKPLQRLFEVELPTASELKNYKATDVVEVVPPVEEKPQEQEKVIEVKEEIKPTEKKVEKVSSKTNILEQVAKFLLSFFKYLK